MAAVDVAQRARRVFVQADEQRRVAVGLARAVQEAVDGAEGGESKVNGIGTIGFGTGVTSGGSGLRCACFFCGTGFTFSRFSTGGEASGSRVITNGACACGAI